MKKLEGKVALITGAAVGLGKGIAEVYAKYGAKLILFDLDKQVQETANWITKEYNTKVISFVGDVSKKEDIQAAVKAGVEHFGTLDILCCNAGVCRLAPFEEFPENVLDFHLNVNIKGVWHACQSAINHFLTVGKGNIVIASSVTGDIVADAGEAAYALTKAALVGLTKSLAVEYAGRNIRVNCTQLGYARTPMVEGMAKETAPEDPESVINGIASAVPMGRLASPKEVGELFAFLGSDESSYLTGSQIVIDGGATLPETLTMGTN